jgi:hypothetical protein
VAQGEFALSADQDFKLGSTPGKHEIAILPTTVVNTFQAALEVAEAAMDRSVTQRRLASAMIRCWEGAVDWDVRSGKKKDEPPPFGFGPEVVINELESWLRQVSLAPPHS